MKLLFKTGFIMILLITPAAVSFPQDAKPLFEIEKKFCKTLTETGISNAFGQYIAEDGILFIPTAAQGKSYYATHKNDFKGLFWEAEFAEMSSSGDFGYTTGPWRSVKISESGDSTITYGHFNTVWQKINGEWKFLIDCGISYPKTAVRKDNAGLKPVQAAEPKNRRFVFEELIEIDNDFALLFTEKSIKEAYEKYASENIKVYRDNFYPTTGFKNSPFLLSAGTFYYTHMGGNASNTGDIAFTYGIISTNPDVPEFNYLKIWKKEGKAWKIVVDVISAVKK